MRMGLIPERVREWIILRSGRFPLPLFDVMGAMLLSRAVMAGVHFGVFDRLKSSPRTAVEMAGQTGCDPHGMELLLDALVSCGYLEKSAHHYRNSRLSQRWLLSESRQTLTNFVRYNYDQWDWTSHLESFVEQGEARDIHEKLDEPRWRNYLLGLRDIATLSADELVSKLKLERPPASLLDVGAGHCHYAITMCRRHPGLRATVVDLEPAARIGRELVAEAGLSQRFEFRHGSVTDAALGENHNVAFLFNVAHHLDEETNRLALRRLHSALAPEGTLVIWESFREEREKQMRDQLGSLLALFFGLVSRRQAYEFDQVAAWARQAGFGTIRRQELRSAPFASLLVAT
jgi:2-polyprenyl-3-methyl-5-hydroxy-6-metoxy-1,4-benzoquinol methylase